MQVIRRVVAPIAQFKSLPLKFFVRCAHCRLSLVRQSPKENLAVDIKRQVLEPVVIFGKYIIRLERDIHPILVPQKMSL